MSDYLDNLKKTDLRPKKIKIGEAKEEILLEKDNISDYKKTKEGEEEGEDLL